MAICQVSFLPFQLNFRLLVRKIECFKFIYRVRVACFWAEVVLFIVERVDLLPESSDLIIGKLQGLLKTSRFERGIIGYPYGNYHYTAKDTPTYDVTHIVPIMPNA